MTQILQLTGPQHTVYHRRTRYRWLHFIFGHKGQARTQQHHPHISIQKTNTYRSILALVQQPLHNSQNSVYNTLAHRAKVVSRTPEDLNKEIEHLNKALRDCHFSNWALNKLQLQFQQKDNLNNNNTQRGETTNNNNQDTNQRQQNKNIFMVVSYIKEIRERFKKICNKQGIQVHFKCTETVKYLLMAPKDKDPKLTKSGIIYGYQCPNINCTEQYIGESGRSLGDRYKEYLKAPSPIHMHTPTTGHPVSPDCFTILDRESQGLTRNIKEAMYIKVNDPSQQEPGKISTSTRLAPSTQGHTLTTTQVTF